MTHFLLCLPLALFVGTASAAYDPCLAAGQEVRKIADARDNGVRLVELFRHADGSFISEAQEDEFFGRAAVVYAYPEISAEEFESSVIDRCEAEDMAARQ